MMFSLISRILKLSGRYRGRIQLAFLFSVIEAILSKMPILYAILVINKLYYKTLETKDCIYIGLLVLITLFLQIIVYHARDRLQSGAGYLLFSDKRLELGNHLRRLPMGYFTEGNIGKISSVLSSDMAYVEEQVMHKIATILSFAFSSFILIIFMFLMDYRLGIVSLLISVIALISGQKMSKQSMKEAVKRQEQNENLTDAVLEFVEGIGVIKSYNLLGERSGEIRENFKITKDKCIEFEKTMAPWMTGLNCLYGIGIAALMSCGISLYVDGNLTLNYVMGMLLFVMEVFNPLKALLSESINLTIMESCLDRLDEIMSEETLPDDGNEKLPENLSKLEVCYDHVSFSYKEQEVLHDVSFVLKPNTLTALVGASGSGKTTIANLLPRFWDVKSGTIKVGGVDIRALPISVLMDQISMVFQRVYLFEDTIYNNILIGRSDATRQEVIEAAKKARCYDFIMKLPGGFETKVGEGGATLSGGEKQRISIARCILKDAPIIILDEATASVDMDNESYIQDAISALVKGKTLLVIAHRLNTIQAADQILVISEGKIIEKGKHDELMKKDGVYHDYLKLRSENRGWSLT